MYYIKVKYVYVNVGVYKRTHDKFFCIHTLLYVCTHMYVSKDAHGCKHMSLCITLAPLQSILTQ
jgi:hypothetical protein